MGDRDGRDGAPAKGFADHGGDVRDAVDVFKGWEAVAADDFVDGFLGFGEGVGEIEEYDEARKERERVLR